MTRYLLALCLGVLGCTRPAPEKEQAAAPTPDRTVFRMYSKAVQDTFSLSVALPQGYDSKKKYPVIYLLDGNIYFDIFAAYLKTYAGIGMQQPAILVGIGHKDLPRMDSLRERDLTYPEAVPEYEMVKSGGADKFRAFLNSELIPRIDSLYSVDPRRRMLFGHSLAGYFVMYALHGQLSEGAGPIHTFIAASPSLHYNHGYLLQAFDKLRLKGIPADTTRFYVTYGGLEDAEEADDPTIPPSRQTLARLSSALHALHCPTLIYRSDTYTALGHMDTPYPTFCRGVR